MRSFDREGAQISERPTACPIGADGTFRTLRSLPDLAVDPVIAEGVHLFNKQQFFEAHEALEAVWLKARGEEKIFLHGLIQVAAAFHHHTRRNSAGFRSLLEKGFAKLERFGPEELGLDVEGLRKQLQRWRKSLSHAHAVSQVKSPPLPQIRVSTQE